ncbi:hypothetical protein J5N97_007462 [Dioscorea zingiberensis]|uniref:Uncharacterized protein n=1 Tax=Dioscorea zingiberensis TaxID=325984 RepID=A0A9D5DBU2_9LILI|nr:hypothetical protein J5N97_007462 [Dioscorea zingiberensis]
MWMSVQTEKVAEKLTGTVIVLSKDSFFEAKLCLETLDKKDVERRRKAELKNNLEVYIYSTQTVIDQEERRINHGFPKIK